jgi:hypothetical protein
MKNSPNNKTGKSGAKAQVLKCETIVEKRQG